MSNRTLSLSYFDYLAHCEFDDSANATNDAQRRMMRRAVLYAIDHSLTMRQKQIFMLYYVDGLNSVRIAEKLGVNKSTVSRTLARAKERVCRQVAYLREGSTFSDD